MSTYWAEAQERYLRKTKQPLTYTGEKWASTTVNNILSFGLSMWNERNIILRGGTKAIARNIYRIDIQQQITKYYQSPTHHILPRHYSRLFRLPLQKQIEKDTPLLKNWLRAYTAAQEE